MLLLEMMLAGAGGCALCNLMVLQLPSEDSLDPDSPAWQREEGGGLETPIKSPEEVIRRQLFVSCRARSQGSPPKNSRLQV